MRYGFSVTFLVAAVLGVIGLLLGYRDPKAALAIVDTVAAVSAILVGSSLAIVAILASPMPIKQSPHTKSVERILNENDVRLATQQVFVFLGFYMNLLTAVGLKYVASLSFNHVFLERVTASVFLGSLLFAFVMSVYLPFLIKSLIAKRKGVS